MNGTATASLNGSVMDEFFSGTYTVSPDCTGKLAISVVDSSGNKLFNGTFDLVFDDNVGEMRAMYTSVTLPDGTALGTVINVDAKRAFPKAATSSKRRPRGAVNQAWPAKKGRKGEIS